MCGRSGGGVRGSRGRVEQGGNKTLSQNSAEKMFFHEKSWAPVVLFATLHNRRDTHRVSQKP